MTITVRNYAPTAEMLDLATIPHFVRNDWIEQVTLIDRRYKGRRFVRLYRDAAGTPFVRDRLHGRRDVVAVQFLLIDGVRLSRASGVVLAPIEGGR